MGLIICPECGRENVSDSAEACPNCGYGIKAHFDKIKREEEIPDKSVVQEKNNHKNSILYNKKAWVIGCLGIIILIYGVLYGTKIMNYHNAVRYYEMKEWKMAIERFEKLGNFSDSEEFLQKAKLELVVDDYELGVFAYSKGDFSTSVHLLEEAKSLLPSYTGLEEQLKLSAFMNDLQGIWESMEINIQVEGFKARVKDYDCTSYADYCDVTPYTDDDGHLVIKVVGETGNRTWELKYEEDSVNPNDIYSSNWIGYASNMNGTGMYFHKK